MTDLSSLENFPVASFDEIAERVKSIYPDPFALQIGAMDGIRFDMLHKHLIRGGWHGLLVEPVPDMFALLQQTYAAYPDLQLANLAIADYNGILQLERIDPVAIAAGLVTAEALGITSGMAGRGVLGDKNLQGAYGTAIDRHRQKLDVPCVTLPQLLQTYRVDKIDLLMIDCEGADWLIAQQLNLVHYRPFGVCLEFTSLTGDEMRDCCQHFVRYNYQLALCREDNQNMLFIRKY